MPWKRLSATIADTQAEQLCDLLSNCGAVSVSVKPADDDVSQALFEPGPGETPLWKVSKVSALFAEDCDPDAVIAAANKACTFDTDADWQTDTLEDQVWERVWMDDFKPRRFAERLWVCPSWLEPPDPDAVNLLMDPGLAFGSGTHPTTTLCLEWLDAHIHGGERLIDFGCGSGILAIAALKLGAGHALGIDNDPQAITATLENARRNDVTTRLTACLADAATPEPCELLLANILAAPLIELAPQLSALVQAQGRIVLSGILDSQVDAVAAHYAGDFDLDAIAHNHEWIRITGTKRP